MAIATLGHVELRCTDLEESRDHFYNVLGFEESFREDGKIYMRAWGDWSAYTLVLTEAEEEGVGHVAFQTETEEDLEEYASKIQDSGYSIEWQEEEAEPKHGKSIRFTGPANFEFELFHSIERVDVPEEKKTPLKNQPQKRVDRGAGVRRIDHVNIFEPNLEEVTEWFVDILDFKLREEVVDEDGDQITAWLSVSPLVHEIAFIKSPEPTLYHLAYYFNSRDELWRAADILKDNQVEMAGGPGKHGASQATYLYHREPSGNVIELFAGGYLIFDPNWETITWTPEEKQVSYTWWGKEITWDPTAKFTPGSGLTTQD